MQSVIQNGSQEFGFRAVAFDTATCTPPVTGLLLEFAVASPIRSSDAPGTSGRRRSSERDGGATAPRSVLNGEDSRSELILINFLDRSLG